jgi:hypothetical protein
MTRQRTPWPRSALWAAEDVTAHLIAIDQDARKAQEMIAAGKLMEAVILLGDIRSRTVDAREALVKGKNGEK